MLFEFSRHYVLPGHGKAILPGETAELTDAEAARLQVYEPGLLKEVRHTTQAHAEVIRSAAETTSPDEAPEEPVKRPRKKK